MSTPLRVPVALLPSDTVFHKGERIGIVVSAEDADWFFANGNEPVMTILHDATHDSTITLPVRPADAPVGMDSRTAALANPFYHAGLLDH